jgi:hypothetical protein
MDGEPGNVASRGERPRQQERWYSGRSLAQDSRAAVRNEKNHTSDTLEEYRHSLQSQVRLRKLHVNVSLPRLAPLSQRWQVFFAVCND